MFPSSQHPTDLSNAFEINTRVHGAKKKKKKVGRETHGLMSVIGCVAKEYTGHK